jgi:hypothetical protein
MDTFYWQDNKQKTDKHLTHNGRFGASGAVARPKVCADLEVSFPSERQWKPRLRQAAGTLSASRRKLCVQASKKKRKNVMYTSKKLV